MFNIVTIGLEKRLTEVGVLHLIFGEMIYYGLKKYISIINIDLYYGLWRSAELIVSYELLRFIVNQKKIESSKNDNYFDFFLVN